MVNQKLLHFRLIVFFELLNYFTADNCKNSNENADKGRIRYVTQTIVLNEWCVELIFDLMYISWCLSRDDNVECGNISAGLV